jgi:hypothetical protein
MAKKEYAYEVRGADGKILDTQLTKQQALRLVMANPGATKRRYQTCWDLSNEFNKLLRGDSQ